MPSDHKTSAYEAPALRALGSVHELTQGDLLGNGSDGLLFKSPLVVRASISGAV